MQLPGCSCRPQTCASVRCTAILSALHSRGKKQQFHTVSAPTPLRSAPSPGSQENSCCNQTTLVEWKTVWLFRWMAAWEPPLPPSMWQRVAIQHGIPSGLPGQYYWAWSWLLGERDTLSLPRTGREKKERSYSDAHLVFYQISFNSSTFQVDWSY